MVNNGFSALVTRIFHQNNLNPQDNQTFSILSLLLLLQITDIYQLKQQDTLKESLENDNDAHSAPENISGLLGQLQGNNNLQQLLPVLMGSLTGGNNNLDISKIAGLLQNFNKNYSNNNDENDSKKTNNQEEDSKKKVINN